MMQFRADVLAAAERLVPAKPPNRPACVYHVYRAIVAERERCAQIADDFDQGPGDDSPMGPVMAAQVHLAQMIALAIRGEGGVSTSLLSSAVAATRLTGPQRAALALAADPGLHRVSGGFAARGKIGRVRLQTIDILIERDLVMVRTGGGCTATDAGRRLLSDLEGRP
jgi:hypothetical protein